MAFRALGWALRYPNRGRYAGDRKVFLSWNLLPDDPASVGFHVYRTQYRHAAGERITSAPITDSTSFLDPNPPGARPAQHTRGEGPDQPDGELRSYYRVRTVTADGRPLTSCVDGHLLHSFECTPGQAGAAGFEPATIGLEGQRSVH